MKKIIIIIFMLFSFVVPCWAENFYIGNYDIVLNVGFDNSYKINEKIDTFFTNSSHGIFRTIPMVNYVKQASGKNYKTKAKISDVYVSEQYSASYENNNYKIKIGSPDKLITGKHSYNISYKYLLQSPENELYFNIIGNDWNTQINKVHFKINMPKDFPYDNVGFSVGEYGIIGYSNGLTYTINKNTNTIEGYTTKQLNPNEAITVRIELPKGYFNKKIDLTKPTCAFLITIFLVISFVYWFIFGKDEKTIPVVNFYPPENMNSARVGLIYSESANTKQIVSLIIYLADKGYINIKDDEIDIELEKIKDYDGKDMEVQSLMDALFKTSTKITISELEVSKSFYIDCQKIIDYLDKKKKEIYEKDSISKSTKIPVILSNIGLIVILFLILTDFNFNTDNSRTLIALSIFPIVNIFILTRNLKKESPFEKKLFFILFSSLHGGIPLLFMIGLSLEAIFDNLSLSIYSIISVIIGFICLIHLPKKNKTTLKNLGHILGFRKFLETAEANRIKKLVEDNPQYCFNMLPYAYVLGVSDKWIEKFENILKGAPDWYQGTLCNRTFHNFANSLEEASMPSVSNGGITHSSSSGGGGSSGGGSGGGGGGSW